MDARTNWNFIQVDQAKTLAALKAARENASRRATCDITYTAVGIGQARQAKMVEFPVTFIEEPHFVSGCGTMKLPDPKRWHDPVGTAGVWKWKRDKKGHYIGAFIWVRVEIEAVNPTGMAIGSQALNIVAPKNLKTLIFMTFSGTATKDLDVPDISTLKTRDVTL